MSGAQKKARGKTTRKHRSKGGEPPGKLTPAQIAPAPQEAPAEEVKATDLESPSPVPELDPPGSAAQLDPPGSVPELDPPGSAAQLDPPGSVAQLDTPGSAAEALDEFFVTADEYERNLQIAIGEGSARAVRGQQAVELLAFWVADEEYCVEIVQIQEIIKVPEVTDVPHAPPGVLGIISLRGTIVAVADLRVILGLGQRAMSRSSRILVLRGGDEPAGLLVDQVTSVVRFDREAIEPVPRTMHRASTEFLQGVGRDGDRFLIVLDLTAVLGAMEYRR